MAKILIAGALDFSNPKARALVEHLGQEVIEQGHILMNGCLNEFDRVVARSAYEAAGARALDANERIVSYAVEGSEPAHQYGTLLRSRLASWGLAFKRLQVPEPIREADAVIIVGGGDGTLCAANWARIDHKPLLPITAFGGAGATTFNEEIKLFDTSPDEDANQFNYSARVDRPQYEALNRLPLDLHELARDVVSLAARVQASKHVFVIMSFSTDPKLHPKLRRLFASFVKICKEYQYECARVDDTAVGRIVPEIQARIQQSAFVIADLTDNSPNVYYELGFAQGIEKPCIVTAYKGTPLPFDVSDMPTTFWTDQARLKDALRERIGKIAALEGRSGSNRRRG
jgi:hypothetical protein